MLCRHCPDSFLSRHENLSGYSTNDNGTELEQVIHAHRTSYRSGWQWFGELTRILTFDQYLLLSVFTSVAVGSSPRSGTVRTLSGMIFVSAQELSGLERFHSRVKQLC